MHTEKQFCEQYYNLKIIFIKNNIDFLKDVPELG